MARERLWGVLAIFAAALLPGCSATTGAPPVTAAILATPHGANADPKSLELGRKIFVTRCIECHSLPAIAEHSAEAWPGLVARMSARAGLKPAEQSALVAYLVVVRRL